MREFLYWAGLTAGLFVLQTSLLPLMAYHGVTGDLLLLFVTSFAFLRGAREGALLGFLSGLMVDLATGTFFGVNTFSRLIIGLLCGLFSDRIFKEQFFLPVLASLGVTVLNYFILSVFMVLLGYRLNILGVQHTLFPMLVYQLAFAYPVHRLAYGLDKRFDEKAQAGR